MAVLKEAKEELPWNADGELVLTAEFWVTVRDWGRGEEEEGEEDRAATREGCDAGKLLAGPWTKSQKSSGSSEKPLWGAEGGGWAQAWVERPQVAEEMGGEVVEEGVGKEAGAPTGPWKSVNSSVSSHKAGGCEWVVTEGWDGDESAKMKK